MCILCSALGFKVVQGGFVFLRLIIQLSIFSLGVVNLERWKPGADPRDGSGAAVRRERRKYGRVVKVVVRETLYVNGTSGCRS